jgi:hypothetical protein
MRWKLLRRRLSISAPRMIVRSHLPWPLRWAVGALALGFSAALALWAFEMGKSLAGLDRNAKVELAELREEVATLRREREGAQSIANTAESLLKTERAAQDQLVRQLKQLEAENQTLKADLGFFERLLPAATSEGLNVRGLRADRPGAGQLRFQALVMQIGRNLPEFAGRYEIVLSGSLAGRPWTLSQPGGPKPLRVKQSLRLEGTLEVPADAVVKQVQLKVTDAQGNVKVSQNAKV